MSERGRKGVWFDRILAIAVLVVMGAVLVQPGGAIRSRIDRFLTARQVGAVLRDHWREIADIDSSRTSDRPVLVEFMDYQCPYCRKAEDTLALFASREDVNIVYRNYPLTVIHPRAEEAARAAVCAEESGVFQQAHTYLIREEWWKDPAPLSARSAELGITDAARFQRCLTSQRVERRLQEDRALGNLLKMQGTPLFVGPEGVHSGLISTSEIDELLGQPRARQP